MNFLPKNLLFREFTPGLKKFTMGFGFGLLPLRNKFGRLNGPLDGDYYNNNPNNLIPFYQFCKKKGHNQSRNKQLIGWVRPDSPRLPVRSRQKTKEVISLGRDWIENNTILEISIFLKSAADSLKKDDRFFWRKKIERRIYIINLLWS